MSDDIPVLVVDDELRMRHLLGKVLAKEGYAVQTSSRGADALKKAKNTPFEIVVTIHVNHSCQPVMPYRHPSP